MQDLVSLVLYHQVRAAKQSRRNIRGKAYWEPETGFVNIAHLLEYFCLSLPL